MNKKLKVVSSIALAGLLALNVCNPKTLATTIQDEIKTSPVGIYKKLVEGKTVVPFVLANAEDCVTYKEIANSDKFVNVTKFNGSSIPNENTLICTGDTFVADGKEYTVVIYGDVNKDGYVDPNDALEIQKYYVGTSELDAIQLEAADAKNNGEVDVNDALNIKKFYVGATSNVIDNLPEVEVEDYDYTLTVNNNNIINNTNTSSEVVIKLVRELAEDKNGLKLVAEDSEGTKSGEVTVNIPAHTTQVTSSISVGSLVDGKITISLFDGEDIVGSVEVLKNTVVPTATNVTTARTSTRTATLSLEAYGESDITKVHYKVDVAGKTYTIDNLDKEINVTSNKVENFEVDTNLTEQQSYTIYYVLENSYGSISSVQKAVIAKDNAQKEEAVEEITVPDLSTTSTKFTWTLTGTKTYTVNLIKDGKVILSNNNVTEKSFTPELSEEGTYKITVKVNGEADGSTADSDTITSDEVTVSRLNEVTNIKLENTEENKAKLTWTNTNEADNINGYSIQLYKLVNNRNEVEEVAVGSAQTIAKDKTEAEITLENENTIYFAKIIVVANSNQKAILSSKGATSNQTYIVGTPSISSTEVTDSSVKLTVTPIAINGKTTNYKVEVYEENDVEPTKPKYTLITTKNVTLNDDNTIVIDGLESNKEYAFKLVAIVDGTEVKSDYTTPAIRTYVTVPSISNVTVASYDNAKEANSGKVAVNTVSKKIVINGMEYDYSAEDFQNSDLTRNSVIISKLNVGDVITIKDNTVTLGLNDNESTRNFTGADMSEITLNVESNKFAKTLVGTVKELSLSGNGSIYDVSGIIADSIVLNDGVEVTGNKTYTIASGATVIINKVTVMATAETEVEANGTNLTITANTTSNNLTFKNTTATTVKFKGLANNSSVQAGTINIVANGDFTLASDKVNVTATINVEAKSGTVDLQEEALNGSKNVNVTKSAEATVTAKFFAKTEAPIELTNVELKDYTDEELVNMSDEESAQELKTYLNSFGINNKGAKITVNEGSNEVTITFDGDKSANAQIKNIK